MAQYLGIGDKDLEDLITSVKKVHPEMILPEPVDPNEYHLGYIID